MYVQYITTIMIPRSRTGDKNRNTTCKVFPTPLQISLSFLASLAYKYMHLAIKVDIPSLVG
jgi:hypothetical protein